MERISIFTQKQNEKKTECDIFVHGNELFRLQVTTTENGTVKTETIDLNFQQLDVLKSALEQMEIKREIKVRFSL